MTKASSGADRYRAAQRKKVAALVGLVVVLGLVWVVTAVTNRPKAVVAKPAQEAASQGERKVGDSGQDPKQSEVRVWWPGELVRDPFDFDRQAYRKRQIVQPTISHHYQLQGTVLGDDPRALINGAVVRPGDTVDGAMVKTITHGHVILSVDGVETTLGP